MIRPQFPYPTPSDCFDEDFIYNFNFVNTPVLGNPIAAGAQLQNIPLQTTPDAPFYWRGVSVSPSNLMIRFKDPAGNFLSDGYIPIDLYAVPAGVVGGVQGSPVILEADAGHGQGAIFCPAGGVVQVNFYNSSGGPLTPTAIQLVGVKRYPRTLRGKC